ELPGVVRSKTKSVPARRYGVVIANRVRKASRRANDGDGSIPKRDQLRQSARLEAGRHPKHVRARIDPLRQCRVETDRDRDLTRRLAGPSTAHVLVSPV